MADRNKPGYMNFDDIADRLESGKLNAYDTVYTKDTHEVVFIREDKSLIRMKARLDVYESVVVAEYNLNLNTDTYVGQLVGIADGEWVNLYMVNYADDKYIVKKVNANEAVLIDDLLTSMQVGGVPSGTNYQKGTLLEKIFRDMLDPILYPTLTPPSASIRVAGNTLLEVGTSKTDLLTTTFDRGSINPAYGTSGYRSGLAQGYILNGGAMQQSNEFSINVDSLHKTFAVTVAYAEGEQPKDSLGNDYGEPLPAGNATSPILTYEFVEALWANTTNPLTIAKLPLISKSEMMIVMQFPPCSSENPEVFDIPTSWNVTAVEVKNDLTGAFDDCSIEFSQTDVEHSDMAGNSVAYTRYTCNLGYDMGSRTIRVKWL